MGGCLESGALLGVTAAPGAEMDTAVGGLARDRTSGQGVSERSYSEALGKVLRSGHNSDPVSGMFPAALALRPGTFLPAPPPPRTGWHGDFLADAFPLGGRTRTGLR